MEKPHSESDRAGFAVVSALWEVSHPSPHGEEKFFRIKAKLTAFYNSLIFFPRGHKLGWLRRAFHEPVCYVFEKVSDSSLPDKFFFPFLHSVPVIVSIHLDTGNHKVFRF